VSRPASIVAQARLIRSMLGHPHYHDFTKLDFKVVDSVDRIQGQQSDIVVISFCRTFGKPKDATRRRTQPRPVPAHYARWLQNINRLNVACTRARRSLVLVGHGNTLRGLNGVPAAEDFYRNLFGLSTQDGLTVRDDWVPGPARRRRR
jgi:superfamily I DNA and/or RNA helicase